MEKSKANKSQNGQATVNSDWICGAKAKESRESFGIDNKRERQDNIRSQRGAQIKLWTHKCSQSRIQRINGQKNGVQNGAGKTQIIK